MRRAFGVGYKEQIDALKVVLCDYFSHGACTTKGQCAITPVGANSDGKKKLKMRWALPGGGKRGGLRLCFLVDCEARHVLCVYASLRRDVTEADIDASFDKS